MLFYIFPDFLFSSVLPRDPFVALTGTADADTCSIVISTLCLKDPLMVHVSPNRNNLCFAVVSSKKRCHVCRTWLVGSPYQGKRTVNNQNNCVLQHHEWDCLFGELFDDKTWETCLLSQGIMWATQLSYNDLSLKFLATLQEQNCAVFSRRGESTGCRDLFCPDQCHCIGVNFLYIWYIVNWGPARSLLDQHQEAGRAGRDGLPSHVLIIYHGQQLKSLWGGYQSNGQGKWVSVCRHINQSMSASSHKSPDTPVAVTVLQDVAVVSVKFEQTFVWTL